MKELEKLSAVEAARLIAARELTSVALVEACLTRIAEREPQVHAWAYLDRDAALARAREIDRDGTRGLLAGVPVAVKDVIDTADLPTQYNSPIYRGYQPRADAACVALARREGAIVLGKTVTTEFASRTPGPTRNPHNPAHTPGGSSSGTAAAVADFMVSFGFGTQTGGSVIRPAAYCGVVGYKPTYGTINCAGMKHLSESLDTIGVMGRTVADCALLVHAVSSRKLPDLSGDLRAPRIGLCRTSRAKEALPETHAALERAASALSARGAKVHDFALPEHFDKIYDDQNVIAGFEAARGLAWEMNTHSEELSDHMRKHIATYAKTPHAEYIEALRHARECREQFAAATADFDVLLTPSAPGYAPEGITSTGNALFNRNWTTLHVPCVTVPAPRSGNVLPLGLQLVGRRDEDEVVLLAAEWLRRVLSS
jgi:Asp-tRNA(Asn)/Glu-tRNA(Gln) amidotransferase A subunit family amidase